MLKGPGAELCQNINIYIYIYIYIYTHKTTAILIWYLKRVKDFILKFLINGNFSWGTQNNSMCYMQYCFFHSGGGVDYVLVWLPLIKQIIKDVNLMCIVFSVKKLQIFCESWKSFSICPESFPICINTYLTHNWWWKYK